WSSDICTSDLQRDDGAEVLPTGADRSRETEPRGRQARDGRGVPHPARSPDPQRGRPGCRAVAAAVETALVGRRSREPPAGEDAPEGVLRSRTSGGGARLRAGGQARDAGGVRRAQGTSLAG